MKKEEKGKNQNILTVPEQKMHPSSQKSDRPPPS